MESEPMLSLHVFQVLIIYTINCINDHDVPNTTRPSLGNSSDSGPNIGLTNQSGNLRITDYTISLDV